MDTMYRDKARKAEEALKEKSASREKQRSSDDYNPRLRPRETHPDAVDPQKRISKNLNKLNRELVKTPADEKVKKEEESAIAEEDRGIRVVTRAAAAKVQAPLSFIFSLIILVAVFMYMLSLSVQMEEYSHSIDEMDVRIAALKEEATQLEVQLENKYDLEEVEQIATEKYGMVAAATLPKKYISVKEETDVWQTPEKEEKNPVLDFFAELFGIEKEGE